MTVWTVGVGVALGARLSPRDGPCPWCWLPCGHSCPQLAGGLAPVDDTVVTPRSVVAVQPGRGPAGEEGDLLAWQERISRAIGENRPDLIVFPERFVPTAPGPGTGDDRLARSLGAPVLFGAVDSLAVDGAEGTPPGDQDSPERHRSLPSCPGPVARSQCRLPGAARAGRPASSPQTTPGAVVGERGPGGCQGCGRIRAGPGGWRVRSRRLAGRYPDLL